MATGTASWTSWRGARRRPGRGARRRPVRGGGLDGDTDGEIDGDRDRELDGELDGGDRNGWGRPAAATSDPADPSGQMFCSVPTHPLVFL